MTSQIMKSLKSNILNLPMTKGIMMFTGFTLTLIYPAPTDAQQLKWQKADSGITSIDINFLFTDEKDIVYAALDAGCYVTTDKGQSWKKLSSPGGGSLFFIADSSTIYLPSGHSIYKSSDHGEHWMRDSILSSFPYYPLYPITSFPNNPAIWIGADIDIGLYRSNDTGKTWTQLTTSHDYVQCSNISIDSSGHIIAAIYPLAEGGSVALSNDTGKTWEKHGIRPGIYPTSFFFPKGSALVLALSPSGIFLSDTRGQTWWPSTLHRNPNCYDCGAYQIVENAQGVLYAATDIGVLQSRDTGSTWTEINDGLPRTNVNSITVDRDGYLYAGLQSGTVFRTLNTTLTGVGLQNAFQPLQYSLLQNYPNPFNPTTNFAFTLAYRSFVTLKVFNLLGTPVSTILSESRSPGAYTIPWNASALPSGTYFYQLDVAPTDPLSHPYHSSSKLLIVR